MKRTCILVLGAHRSGTSALTRVLNLLGADLPANLLEPRADNPTGFWESRDHMVLNDQLLARLETRWDSPLGARWDLMDVASFTFYRDRIVELLHRDFTSSALFVVKDPRLCRLLPIWQSALEQFDTRPKCVLIIRHPLEVAGSLAARHGMPLQSGLLIWLRHTLEAESTSRNLDRIFVSYELLLNDWRAVTARISKALNIEWPRRVDEAAGDIDVFLQRDLRHHVVGNAIHDGALAGEMFPAIYKTYEAGCAAVKGDSVDIATVCDAVSAFLSDAEALMTPIVSESRAALVDNERLRADEMRLRTLLEERERQLSSLRQSTLSLGAELETLKRKAEAWESQLGNLQQSTLSLGAELRTREEEAERLRADTERTSKILIQRDAERLSLTRAIAELRRTEASLRQGEAALGRAIAERDYMLSTLGTELLELRRSLSWRLTAPLREICRFWDRLRRTLLPRKYQFDLHPAFQLRSIDPSLHTWEAQGLDPQFLLIPKRSRFPTRWCKIEIELDNLDNAQQAVLYVDSGGGFTEDTAIVLPYHLRGILKARIELPRRVRALRFDPRQEPGQFHIQPPIVREVRRRKRKHPAIDAPSCQDSPVSSDNTSGIDIKLVTRHRLQVELEAFLASGAELVLPQPEEPRVSIVLVLYNQAPLTYNCLCSIVSHAPRDSEIIIVDNASTDDTAALLHHVRGAVVLRNTDNRYYPPACNQGAARARGHYLLLLNNDAELMPGSLNAAIAILQDPEVGAVGGRIINFSGHLQEAGQLLWSDGSSMGYGRGDICDRPQYMFRRDVDYCSAAFLLTRTQLFRELGGFDEAFSPAYYEETDFCIKLWERGLRVVYEPRATILHYEFGSWGSDLAGELMTRNRELILAKHPDFFAARTSPDPAEIERARYARCPGPRVLFIDDCIPHSDQGTGYPRANAIANTMVQIGAALTLFPMMQSDEPWQRVYRDLRPEIEVIKDGNAESLSRFIAERGVGYDLIFVSRPHNMRHLLHVFEHNSLRGAVHLVYDAEAVFALRTREKIRILGERAGNADTAANEMMEELELASKADRVVCVSESERRHFVSHGLQPVYVLGHRVEPEPSANAFEQRRDILFVGAMKSPDSPNEDSVLWFSKHVLPIVRAKLASEDVHLIVTGQNTVERLSAVADNPSVKLVGSAEDLSHYYEGARMFVAPTRFAAGIPYKAHEAASRGLPMVTTTLIAAQLGWSDGEELLTAPATDPEQFADQCVRLYTDQKLWSRVREQALSRVREECNPTSFAENLKAIITRPLAPNTVKYAQWIRAYDKLNADDKMLITSRISSATQAPVISVLVPLYNTPERWLRRCIESVLDQLYSNWQLCLVDDASTDPHVASLCREYAARDHRIQFVRRDVNGHIAAATNTALALATGDFIGLLDHDDELAEHALYMIAEALEDDPKLDLIFTDEDKIDEQGTRYDPWFKSDWNYDLMLSQNAVVHFAVFRRSILQQIGGLREGYEGSQDYDLTLRFLERTIPARIRHLPFVLYHWRAIPGSVALSTDQKDYPYEHAARAIQEHLDRVSPGASVTREPHQGYYRVHWPLPAELPRVAVIIPTRDGVHLLRAAVESILEKSTYSNFEILVINNRSTLPETRDFLTDLAKHPKVRVLDFDQPYNFASLNNWAVEHTEAPLIAFLNNDTEVLSSGWLSEMVSHALRPEVGAVGAMLYYPDETIQHAGVVVGIGGTAGHPHRGLPRGQLGYFGRAAVTQQFSAVTAACMVMRRKVFLEVGGFDHTHFAVSFNDVDIGLRLRRAGYSVVWTPYAELVHHESATLGLPDAPQRREQYARECANLRERWPHALANDPFYNPNLTITGGDFALAFPPRIHKPWATNTSVAAAGSLTASGHQRPDVFELLDEQ